MFFGVRSPESEQQYVFTCQPDDILRRIEISNKMEAAARIKRLKAWAIEEGSDLLKARIEEGFEWEDLAETEWYDKYVEKHRQKPPSGYVLIRQNNALHECRQPSLQQIEGLRIARQVFSKLSWFNKIDIVSFSINDKKCLDDWAYRVQFVSPSGKVHQILVTPF